ncbi:MAG TPA: helix-turn-helix domain-containing protein [Candidatus Gracilibacteria bacterium]
MMEVLLQTLGLNEKEIKVYLTLLELGMVPAANIAKKIEIPKSTVLFLLERLVALGYAEKTQRSNTQYFFTDPKLLLEAKKKALEAESRALEEVMPLLSEMKNPYSSRPRVTFFEGVGGCKKLYRKMLEADHEVLEFGIHKDLEDKMGAEFMDQFIVDRVKKGLYLRAISSPNAVDKALSKLDEGHLREQKFLSEKEETYSSIAIYGEKVMLLNLRHDAFGILIESAEISQTLRTIFEVLWQKI